MIGAFHRTVPSSTLNASMPSARDTTSWSPPATTPERPADSSSARTLPVASSMTIVWLYDVATTPTSVTCNAVGVQPSCCRQRIDGSGASLSTTAARTASAASDGSSAGAAPRSRPNAATAAPSTTATARTDAYDIIRRRRAAVRARRRDSGRGWWGKVVASTSNPDADR
jgi:hypothetical protein